MRKILFAFGAAAVVMLSMCSCEPAPEKKPAKTQAQKNPGGRFVNKTVEKLQLDNAKRNAEYEKAAL